MVLLVLEYEYCCPGEKVLIVGGEGLKISEYFVESSGTIIAISNYCEMLVRRGGKGPK